MFPIVNLLGPDLFPDGNESFWPYHNLYTGKREGRLKTKYLRGLLVLIPLFRAFGTLIEKCGGVLYRLGAEALAPVFVPASKQSRAHSVELAVCALCRVRPEVEGNRLDPLLVPPETVCSCQRTDRQVMKWSEGLCLANCQMAQGRRALR